MNDDWHTFFDGKEEAREVQYNLQKVQCYPHGFLGQFSDSPSRGCASFIKMRILYFFIYIYFCILMSLFHAAYLIFQQKILGILAC